MKRLIIIEEICDDGSYAGPFDYDMLPSIVKEKVDEALGNEFGTIECDIYECGLQYLSIIDHPEIKKGEIVEYFGSVQLYSY